MTRAKISELKAKLSAYIARARRGDSIVIMDRETPVAKLVPWDDQSSLPTIRAATAPASSVRQRSKVRLLKPIDSLALLSEDRDER